MCGLGCAGGTKVGHSRLPPATGAATGSLGEALRSVSTDSASDVSKDGCGVGLLPLTSSACWSSPWKGSLSSAGTACTKHCISDKQELLGLARGSAAGAAIPTAASES